MILEFDIILWIGLSKRKERKKKIYRYLRCLSHASNPLGFGGWQPICQTIPLHTTSLALKMLFHAYDPLVEELASRMEQSGTKRALKTLWQSDSGFFNMRQTCLANSASLNFSISLNPMPPHFLAWQSLSHFIQCTFLLSPLQPHQNLWIITSISWINPMGSLKQLME